MRIRPLLFIAISAALATSTISPCELEVHNGTQDFLLVVFSDTKEAWTVSPSERQKMGSVDRLAHITIYRGVGRRGYYTPWYRMNQTSCTLDKLVRLKVNNKGIDKKAMGQYFKITQQTPKKKIPKLKNPAIQVNNDRYRSILLVAADGSHARAVYKNSVENLGKKGEAAQIYV